MGAVGGVVGYNGWLAKIGAVISTLKARSAVCFARCNWVDF